MIKYSPPQSLARISILIICLLLLVATQFTGLVEAQNCPTVPLHSGNTAYTSSWASGSTVTVKIDSVYSEAQRQAIENGIRSWAGVVNVTFTGFQSTSGLSATAAPPPGEMHVVQFDTGEDNANYLVFDPNNTGRIGSSIIRIHPDKTDPGSLGGTGAHETGHQLGLAHCDNCDPSMTIMAAPPNHGNVPPTQRNSTYGTPPGLQGPTQCDVQALSGFYPTPTPPPCPDDDNDGVCNDSDCSDNNPYASQDVDGDGYCEDVDCQDGDPLTHPGASTTDCSVWHDSDCDGKTNDMECVWSPIVVDVLGDGFNLTDAVSGVSFDLNSDGVTDRLAWTSPNSDDSWLALDRNGSGTIDDGRELFGNFTPQPLSSEPNGFLALAEFDKAENGGNGDGIIDTNDDIFPSLRLWQDINHNGVSEPQELQTVSARGLKTIYLDYKVSKRVDRHGNRFRYRSKVKDMRGAQLGRWAWDVFLVRG